MRPLPPSEDLPSSPRPRRRLSFQRKVASNVHAEDTFMAFMEVELDDMMLIKDVCRDLDSRASLSTAAPDDEEDDTQSARLVASLSTGLPCTPGRRRHTADA